MSNKKWVITISAPRDCESETRFSAALRECYVNDINASELDDLLAIKNRLLDVANAAGLEYIESTDFGVKYRGNKNQIVQVRVHLPTWAYVEVQEDETL